MLLRSPSSPILSSLTSHADLFLEADHESSPHRLVPAPQRRGRSVHSAFSDPDAVKSLPRILRAHSEGDLEGLCWRHASPAAEESAENRWRPCTKGIFTKLSISEEEESDLVTEEYSSGVRASSCGLQEDTQMKARVSSMGGSMYLASGLGICMGAEGPNNGGAGGRGGGRRGYGPSGSFHGDSDIMEAYYQELLLADPQNPLLLRNYAEYLSEAKHDHKKSEEYYERAILASPNDGEVLSKYAKHVWDVHKDYNRAGSYFDQAVKAAPDDCYVLASHASFLWQSEDDEESDAIPHTVLPSLHGVSAGSLPLIAAA